jgi:hypothetical protein
MEASATAVGAALAASWRMQPLCHRHLLPFFSLRFLIAGCSQLWSSAGRTGRARLGNSGVKAAAALQHGLGGFDSADCSSPPWPTDRFFSDGEARALFGTETCSRELH